VLRGHRRAAKRLAEGEVDGGATLGTSVHAQKSEVGVHGRLMLVRGADEEPVAGSPKGEREPKEAPTSQPPPRRLSSIPPPGQSPSAALREACALAVVCALVGSIPSALRAAREGGALFGGWLASAATVLPLLIVFIALSRAAGRGFRMLTGNRAGRSTAAGLALWIGLSSPVLVIFATVLKSSTNHRGIGGATFGVGALGVVLLGALVAQRGVTLARSLVERGTSARLVAMVFAVITIAPILGVTALVARSGEESASGRSLVSTIIDGAIFVVAGALAASFEMKGDLKARARSFGPFAAVILFASGILWVTSSSTLAPAVRRGGGLAAAVMSGIGRPAEHAD
jgi:choline-sulfatase